MTRCVSALVLLSALSACSSQPDSSSESTAAPAITDSTPVPQRDDVPREDMTNEHTVEWDALEVFSETSIRISFWAGTESCFGTRAIVEESDTTIAIAAIEGTLPDAPEVCTDEGRRASLVVETDKPIGGREITALLDPPGLK